MNNLLKKTIFSASVVLATAAVLMPVPLFAAGVPNVITESATNVSQNSATVNGQVNPNEAATSYWFEWGTGTSLGNTTAAQSVGSASYQIPVSAGIAGLQTQTTYYFRTVAQNQYGTSYGTIFSFSTTACCGGGGQNTAPTVTTDPASNISTNTATFNGRVNPNSAATSYWFEWGRTTSLGNSTQVQSAGSGSSLFSVLQSNNALQSNTTYYFRAVAQNQYGTTYGSILSFVTNTGGGGGGSSPAVLTSPATNISQNVATLNGQVNPNGWQTSYWFEWGTSQSLGNTTGAQSLGSGTSYLAVFNSISGLQSNVTYYFRVVAQNQYDTVRGSILSFSTGFGGGGGGNAPSVQTNSATNVSYNSATLNGYVNNNNDGALYVWFEYGPSYGSLSYTTSQRYIGSWNINQNFSDTVSSLSNRTTYYFRAVARNDAGTYYGQTLSFVAGGSCYGGSCGQYGYYGYGYGQQPSVVTNPATFIGQNFALLNGQVNPNGYTANAWFEYGTTMSLGSQTPNQSVGSGSNLSPLAYALSGLFPNTTYYFRAVAQGQGNTAYGSILSFVTTQTTVITQPTVIQSPVVVQPSVVVRGGTVAGATGLSCVLLVPALNVSSLAEQGEFVYTVTYRNGCSYPLNNAFLKVILPTEVEFIDTNYPFFNRDANGISYNLGAVSSGYQSAISIHGRVRSGVSVGSTLIFSAVLNFTDNNDRFQSISAYLTATIGQIRTLSATIFDAVRNLFGNWLFDLILILLVLFLVWWIFFRREREDEIERVDVLKE